MNVKDNTGTIVMRDELGLWYLLTPQVLAGAKATTEQATELKRRFDNDTAGFLLATLPKGPRSMIAAQPVFEIAGLVMNGPGRAVRSQNPAPVVEAPTQGPARRSRTF